MLSTQDNQTIIETFTNEEAAELGAFEETGLTIEDILDEASEGEDEQNI